MLGLWLDLVIFRVFSNVNDSMILKCEFSEVIVLSLAGTASAEVSERT